MEKKTVDPKLTVQIKNDELEHLVIEYIKERTADNLNKLLNHLTTCRVLIPAAMDEKTKKAMPALVKNNEGITYLPIYTSLKQTAKAPRSAGILNMPYLQANGIVAESQGKVQGVVINPFTENLILKEELIKKIVEVEEMKKKGIKQVKMTGAQYAVFERLSFEKGYLPRKLYEGGKEFIQYLIERKETYLDVLFEESYQQKRMYPYLEEEFSVMPMNISQELTVVRVEFPNRDLAPGVCLRAFLAWNERTGEGRYFTIELGKEKGTRNFGEVSKELKYISYGEAPVDGAELQRVIDLIDGSAEGGYTS